MFTRKLNLKKEERSDLKCFSSY